MSRKQFVVTLSLAAFCGLLGGLLGVWLFLPQKVFAQGFSDPSTEVITAGMFRVMDGEGKIRASFGVGPTGAAYLAINDKTAQLRTGLAVYQGNPSLVFYHKDADTQAGFPHPLDEGSGVWLYDEQNNLRAILGSLPERGGSGTPESSSSLVLLDESGNILSKVP
jgi:hypothetical protein